MMLAIEDASAALLDPFRNLQAIDAPQRHDLVIAEGAENVRWLLTSRLEVLAVLGKATCADALAIDLAARTPPTPMIIGSRQAIDAVVGFPFSRGVLACARRPQPMALEGLLDLVGDLSAGLVLLDGVHDHANVGATIRNARCFGLAGAVVTSGCADPWFRRTIRVSVGHVFHLPLAHHPDATGAVLALRRRGYQVLAAHRGPLARPILEVTSVSRKWCLVLGNEDRGPHPETLAACDGSVSIDMAEGTDSLNVATAGAVLMHVLRSLAARTLPPG